MNFHRNNIDDTVINVMIVKLETDSNSNHLSCS